MPTSPLVPGRVPARVAASARYGEQSASEKGWLQTMAVWIARCRQRRALGELANLDSRLLHDIGLSKDEALREAARPFWRR